MLLRPPLSVNILFTTENYSCSHIGHLSTTQTRIRLSTLVHRAHVHAYHRSRQSPPQPYPLRHRIAVPQLSSKNLVPFRIQRRTTQLQALLGEADIMDAYKFPDYRLKRKLDDPSKTPLLLVACGSFSPITFLHLRMFVMAGDYVKENTNFELIGGYLSPVSDAYKKQGLAAAEHR